ncbi:MAG: alpha-amylase [Lachnospiraceae bacterium]|nr:alpha-amylase [Lachnospiraceae bacterium]
MKNETIMQYFEWYLPEDASHWKRAAKEAKNLVKDGITKVWFPPAYKGASGIHDVGYGVYDGYDLGEFDQKGTIPTKYGTKEEYIKAVKAMQKAGIEVLGDMVLNHRMGADEKEWVNAVEDQAGNRLEVISGEKQIEAWTKFTYSGRGGKYSDFTWNAVHFDGVDWDDHEKRNGVFLFQNKEWDKEVDGENVNYDYLMGADLDLDHPEVKEELDRFGKWYMDETGIDGFRLDAVKHMNAGFYRDWLRSMKSYMNKNLFAVGEYWSADLSKLKGYLAKTEGEMRLFDVPLHFRFFDISHGNGSYDMGRLFENTLVETDGEHAVTFVDNHDTQPGQALCTFVMDWFKPLAYGIILLQEKGVPCVFYGDYYGIPHDGIESVKHLRELMRIRQSLAYGTEHDYYDHHDVVGFTREGLGKDDGLALLISDGPGGTKEMFVGAAHGGQIYVDALGNCPEEVMVDSDGKGIFRVEGGSISVWISKTAIF